jgi:hypothetical protein
MSAELLCRCFVSRRFTRVVLTMVFGLTTWLGLGCVPASAKVVHQLVARFNGQDAPGGPMGSILDSDAVDQASGDVYVLEFGLSGPGVVDKFDENGVYASVQLTGAQTPQGSFGFGTGSGVAVDNSLGVNSGDVYVSDTGHGLVDRFSSTGEFLCQIAGGETQTESPCKSGGSGLAGVIEPAGVAIDANGNVYVADNAHEAIDKFNAAGEYTGQIKGPDLSGSMATIALDSSGDLYITNFSLNVVKVDSQGNESVFASNTDYGVAVDPATGHVVVTDSGGSEGFELAEYDASGVLLGTFSNAHTNWAIAINGSSGRLYAPGVFQQGYTTIFGPATAIPDVDVTAVTNLQSKSVMLNGHVDPDVAHGGGEVTSCAFEYGTSKSYGQSAQCSPPLPYATGADVSADLQGISPSTTYYYRLNAANSNGVPDYATGEFTTSGSPAVDLELANAVVKTATVFALVNPFGLDTTCSVQYVDEAGFNASGYANASSVPCTPTDLGSGFGDQVASAALEGLRAGGLYHYRFVAVNREGSTVGPDETVATFGASSFSMEALDREGRPYTQAGGHPYKLVTSFALNQSYAGTRKAQREESAEKGLLGKETVADANVKDIEAELPVGFLGDATIMPRCTRSDLMNNRCPGDSQVGILAAGWTEAGYNHYTLFNMVPPPGVPVEFGVHEETIGFNIYIDANVRTGGDYGVTGVSLDTTSAVNLKRVKVELWGEPADPSHDSERACPPGPFGERSPPGCSAGITPVPFLTNPTHCGGPLTAAVRVDSWQDPGEFVRTTATVPAITGCDKLQFVPSISVLPDTTAADSPSGMLVKLTVPQNPASGGLATPSLRTAKVTLPAGVTLNPAAANGLQACSTAQIGLNNASEPQCPDASKIGSVEIETPLLADKLLGSVYLAEQNNNPFGSTFAIYVAAQVDGASVKVAGDVEADPLTGQLTTTFSDNPQVPFSDFRLHFFGGARAPLATPKTCGTYETTSVLTPWSAPESGASALPLSSFQIDSGPYGTACQQPGFAPSFSAGTTSNQAGGFSPFTLRMSRNDGEQNLGVVSTAMPPGVSAMLSKIPLCGEPQAAQGSCPAASMIGHVEVGVGTGPYPLQTPEPGRPQDPVFLTGPYEGAPFGLSVVVPAQAGPFDLDENGKPVVVRARINLDPNTAQVTVTSDPLPQMLKGVPLDIRYVNVVIDRPEFIFNSTNCQPMQIGGNLTSAAGATVGVSVPFQVTNCAALGFKPGFKVSTSGKTSRSKGASLTAKLTYPKAPFGSQANIARVKVDLPKQLPSRLTTLQKACTAAQFNADPAGCPAASFIGHAKAITPILPVPLEGPAIFVSHGGEAFPSLIVVLQGYGVTIDLVGSTFISKAGITSSTFKTVPDQPVTSFELTLPEGKYSALAANGNLCASKLTMPTEFVAQNGLKINESTPVSVTGCAKKKTLTRAQKLAAAMKACHKKAKGKQAACAAKARKQFGPVKKKGKK